MGALPREQQRTDAVAAAAQAIFAAEPGQRFLTWVNLSDPNQPYSLTLDHLEHLAIDLNRFSAASSVPDPEIQQLTSGIKKGLESWRSLEGHLIEWVYEPTASLAWRQSHSNTDPGLFGQPILKVLSASDLSDFGSESTGRRTGVSAAV